MSLEHSPARIGHNGGPSLEDDPEFWHSLIDERAAADFLGLEPRTLQNWRQSGIGPEYIRISSRCVRYTRGRCKVFADDRARRSTSDPGNGAAG